MKCRGNGTVEVMRLNRRITREKDWVDISTGSKYRKSTTDWHALYKWYLSHSMGTDIVSVLVYSLSCFMYLNDPQKYESECIHICSECFVTDFVKYRPIQPILIGSCTWSYMIVTLHCNMVLSNYPGYDQLYSEIQSGCFSTK